MRRVVLDPGTNLVTDCALAKLKDIICRHLEQTRELPHFNRVGAVEPDGIKERATLGTANLVSVALTHNLGTLFGLKRSERFYLLQNAVQIVYTLRLGDEQRIFGR